jgi:hypothetical protein
MPIRIGRLSAFYINVTEGIWNTEKSLSGLAPSTRRNRNLQQLLAKIRLCPIGCHLQAQARQKVSSDAMGAGVEGFFLAVSTLAGYVYFHSIIYIQLLGFRESGIADFRVWGFGQVIAITLWVPSAVEFVYLEFRKFPSNSVRQWGRRH